MRIHDRIEAGFESWGLLVVRHKFVVALACLAGSLVFVAFLPQLEADNSTESFLKPGDPARIEYDAFRAQFGQDEELLVAIQPPEIFDLSFLEKLRSLHRDIESDVPYIEEVTSLWNVRNTRGEGDRLVVEDLMEDWPETAEDLAELRTRVLGTPAYRNTVIDLDATVTTLLLEPFVYSTLGDSGDSLAGFDAEEPGAAAEPAFLTEAENIELVRALREVVARYEGPDFRVYLAGGGIVDQALTETLMRDSAIFLSAGALLMALLLFALFRRASGVLLPVFVVMLTIVVNFGAMAMLGIPTSISGQVLPILVLVVGISGAIHILAIVFHWIGEGVPKEIAIARALGHSGLAVLMAAVTTAGGVISFAFAGMAQIANLGLAAPIGVMLTFVYSVTLLPALLAIVPLRASRFGGDGFRRRLAAGLVRVGDTATQRPRGVLLVTTVIVLVAGVGVSRMTFSNDGMRWFPEDDPNRVAQEFLDARLGGAGGVEVWVDTGKENGLHDPKLMRALEDAGEFAAGLEEGGGELSVGNVLSVVDLVKETHKALNENLDEFYTLPEDRSLLAQELLLFENSGPEHLEDFVDSRFSMARISLRTPFTDGNLFDPFLARLEAGLVERFEGAAEIRVTGMGAIMGRTFSILNVTMAQSYALALVVITPLMVLLIGNLRLGLLAMIPNLLPIWLTLGLMGVLDIPLDNSTLLVGCVLIGLAVDDTIHFMHKFQRYLHDTGDARQAVRDTLRTTGAALFFTTLVLTAGFSVMLFGYMTNAREFGFLAAFAAAIAFLADLIVAPALMQLAAPGAATKPSTSRRAAA